MDEGKFVEWLNQDQEPPSSITNYFIKRIRTNIYQRCVLLNVSVLCECLDS